MSEDSDEFLSLLRSARAADVSSALWAFQHADAATRHGVSNPLGDHEPEVFARAREVMHGLLTSADETAELFTNALLVLKNVADARDVSTIVVALRSGASQDLKLAACLAGGNVLRLGVPDDELVSALTDVVHDGTVLLDVRTAALSAIGHADSSRAANVLVAALSLPDIALQIDAAWSLLCRADARAYRPQVVRVVETWPSDPPYPANEVLQLLDASEAEHRS